MVLGVAFLFTSDCSPSIKSKYTTRENFEDHGRLLIYDFAYKSKPITFKEAIVRLQQDKIFRELMSDTFVTTQHTTPYVWETIPVSQNTLSRTEFKFVLVRDDSINKTRNTEIVSLNTQVTNPNPSQSTPENDSPKNNPENEEKTIKDLSVDQYLISEEDFLNVSPVNKGVAAINEEEINQETQLNLPLTSKEIDSFDNNLDNDELVNNLDNDELVNNLDNGELVNNLDNGEPVNNLGNDELVNNLGNNELDNNLDNDELVNNLDNDNDNELVSIKREGTTQDILVIPRLISKEHGNTIDGISEFFPNALDEILQEFWLKVGENIEIKLKESGEQPIWLSSYIGQSKEQPLARISSCSNGYRYVPYQTFKRKM